jgi:Arf-GAP/coiled-coil/ANK repeat/PH domain-containing protein
VGPFGRTYDKRLHAYDAAKGRYLALVKETKAEVLASAEEELARKKAKFDGARFALAAALQRAHTARRCAYSEAAAAAARAHAAFFRAGDEACSALDGRAASLRTAAAAERAAAGRAQAALAQHAAALAGPTGAMAPTHGRSNSGSGANAVVVDGVLAFGTPGSDADYDDVSPRSTRISGPGSVRASSPPPADASPAFGTMLASGRSRSVAAAMAAAAAGGAVTPLKQGYLLKQSHSLVAHWKRRYFVLDTRGDLRYFRDEQTGLLDRLGRTPRVVDAAAAAATVSLLTSTIKRDGGDAAPGLRFCFRVVSPAKEYVLQAENAAEQADWMEAIAGVIGELLASATHPEPPLPVLLEVAAQGPPAWRRGGMRRSDSSSSAGEGIGLGLAPAGGASAPWDLDALAAAIGSDAPPSPLLPPGAGHRRVRSAGNGSEVTPSPASLLRGVAGNSACADCRAPSPEWASLNIGCLLCLQCSGLHRALGVHVSKVRSLSLDTRVWEPAVMAVMAAGGNAAVNAVLEASPAAAAARPPPGTGGEAQAAYIRAKYARAWLAPGAAACAAAALGRAVAIGDTAGALAALLAGASPDALAARGLSFEELASDSESEGSSRGGAAWRARRASQGGADSPTALVAAAARAAVGRSLLHCAATDGHAAMTELLLLHGARCDPRDADGRTPLHLACAAAARSAQGSPEAECARRLLRAGASVAVADASGRTPAQMAVGPDGQVPDAALDAALAEAVAPPAAPQPPPGPPAGSPGPMPGGRSGLPSGRHRRMGSRDIIEGIASNLGSIFQRSGGSGGAQTGSGPASAPQGLSFPPAEQPVGIRRAQSGSTKTLI